jgi:hypothetical protein
MKRILSIIIIGFLMISLPGCNIKPAVSRNHMPMLVKKTEKAKYLITNGLKIDQQPDIIDAGSGDVSINLPSIKWLKDKKLERKINNNIKFDVKNELKDYEAEMGQRIDYAYCVVDLNVNNLLSVNINIGYNKPIAGILYNLTNGKRLDLGDIFTRGTDYIALINREITLSMLGGSAPDENLLSKPFTTIKPDQTYALTESTLYIIFHAGESGFENRNAIGIPISKIDDFVDIIDREAGKQFTKGGENFSDSGLIFKRNNIFDTLKGVVFKRNNGNIAAFFPVISGIKDSNFENTINAFIMKKVKEIVNLKQWDSIKSPDQIDNHLGTVYITDIFNAYGILSLSLNVDDVVDYKDFQDIYPIYSFDLVNNKSIEIKDIINDYKMKNKGFEKVFVEQVKESIKKQITYINRTLVDKFCSALDYQYIMKNASINFEVFGDPISLQIAIKFQKIKMDGIPDSLYCSAPLKEIIKCTPEEFLCR